MRSEESNGAATGTPEGIEQIDRQVIQLFALVGDGIAGATHALLAGDREAARGLVARDEEVDALYRQIERLVQDELASTAVGSGRLRYLIALLGVLPELERSGDLAEHVARRAVRGIAVEMSARARGLIERMGEVACTMWRMTAESSTTSTSAVVVSRLMPAGAAGRVASRRARRARSDRGRGGGPREA